MDKTILVKTGWQDVNIGDIGHSPGLFALLEIHAPGARLIFWPNDDNPEVDEMMRRRFPHIEIVRGRVDDDGPDTPELCDAFERADLLIHGSGPSLVAWRSVAGWKRSTGKPFGVYGITLSSISDNLKEVLDGASFIFTRESISLETLREAKVDCPLIGFAPDACVASDVRNDEKAMKWLERAELEEGQFICVIARNRKTPYYWSKQGVHWTQDRIREVEDINYRHRQEDLPKLREAITIFVRETGMKVLLCPEMVDALALLGPHVYAPLPDDVRPYVAIRDKWWITDEAASIYAKSFAVLSLDCHSPLIAYAQCTPTVYARQPQDARKAHMYIDFGMGDWLMPIEETDGKALAEKMLEIYREPQAAAAYLAQGNLRIATIHEDTLTAALKAVFGK